VEFVSISTQKYDEAGAFSFRAGVASRTLLDMSLADAWRALPTIFLLRRKKRVVSHENMLHQEVSEDTTTLSVNPDTCQPRQPRSMVSEVEVPCLNLDLTMNDIEARMALARLIAPRAAHRLVAR
jgi:hypothetical protein